MPERSEPDFAARVQRIVARIPRGKVATYGQVAALAGKPGAARQVGRTLFQLREGAKLPWHRVLNARGEISYHPARRGADDFQRVLLEAEGVVFDAGGRLDLATTLWRPRS